MKLELLAFLLCASIPCAVHSETGVPCMQLHMSSCLVIIGLRPDTMIDPQRLRFEENCEKIDIVNDCMRKAFAACQVDTIKEDLDSFISALKEFCTNGTELNKKYMNVTMSGCFLEWGNSLGYDLSCIQDLFNIPSYIWSLSSEDITKYSKIYCDTVPKMLDCFYKSGDKFCSDLRIVLSAVGEPTRKLMQKTCQKGLSGGGAGTSALSWTLLVASTLLVVL